LVSIIVPTYQEAENLPYLISRIENSLVSLGFPYEVIFVDDNSQDGTEEVISNYAAKGHPVRLITRIGERGLSSAVVRGFCEAGGRILVCMDADLSHPPEAIPDLLEPLLDSKADFVIASRYMSGASTDQDWGIFRWLNSRLATLMAKPFTRVTDPMSGFFALPLEVFNKAVSLDPIGYKIGLELVVKCPCRKIYEVPIHFANRRHGESKLNLKEQINYLKHLKRLADYKYGEFSRLAQFVLVGSTGMVADLTLFATLLEIAAPLMLARGLAIWTALTWNFWLNRRVTFSYSRDANLFEQYLKFAISCGFGALLSWSVSVSLIGYVTIFSKRPLVAAFLGIAIGTLSNFLLSRCWAFKKKPES